MDLFTNVHFEASKNLLSLAQAGQLNEDHIDALRQVINEADKAYYVQDNPYLADVEYDQLFAALISLEEKFPDRITQDSPTQRVAKGLNKSFNSVPHLVPMLSLENSYNEEDLRSWDKRIKEFNPDQSITYCVEPKYDGASISLVYENDMLVRAATRGDGVMGDDITTNAKQIKTIPLSAPLSKFGITQLEVRGEVLINKKRFEALNNSFLEQGIEPLANARNAASGSLRMKDPNEVAKRNLEAYLYHIAYVQTTEGYTAQSHTDLLKLLQDAGFLSSYANAKICDSIEEVIEYVKQYEEQRDSLQYEIDGMVIKVNSLAQQENTGQTSHHPRWAMAYKFKARQATSKLLAVEYQVGRTGSITPVGKIAPTQIGGVTVTSISLHNEELIKQKDLMLGDAVLVERAGDVIPYLVKSFPDQRQGTEQPIVFPSHCPVCSELLEKPIGEAVWRCVNPSCKAQVVERIIHFSSKDAMDIRGLGDANIRKFFELGWLNNLADIYQLPYDTIKNMEGFGAKSIDKMKEAIEASKAQPLNRVIYGLGIRYVGETTAKTLAAAVNHISDFYSYSLDQYKLLEDIGEKVAGSLEQFFSHQQNRELIASLEQLGVNFSNVQRVNALSGGLSGKSFLFTGTLSQFKRSDAEARVEALGGQILSGVSAKLNYLVVGESAGSKLEKAKKMGTITILNEEEFLELMKTAES